MREALHGGEENRKSNNWAGRELSRSRKHVPVVEGGETSNIERPTDRASWRTFDPPRGRFTPGSSRGNPEAAIRRRSGLGAH
jgi:hypothetical protein